MQLQNAKQRFESQGLKLAAISYDSPAILKDFAERYKIEFPLLADPDSEVIRSFNVLNAEAKGMTKGMAYPGFIYIDSSGIIRERYFEAKYTNRFTANSVIEKLIPELTEEVSQTVEAPHLRLGLSQSDRAVVAGSRVTLTAEIELQPDVHVYSPGVRGYKPIQLVLQASGAIEPSAVVYPSPKSLYLQPIKEQVPVFEGKFKITQDVTVSASKTGDGIRALLSASKTISITGQLQYQACDKTICYPPTSVPVKWELQVRPLDLKRSPKAIQHKWSWIDWALICGAWKEKTMSNVVYVSKSRIERRQGPLRIAQLPGESNPVIYSVHGAIAEHYKVDRAKLEESHSSTIDYVISATAGWMMGTLGGALEARQIDASNGKLTAEVTGEVETEDGVLVIRRIHVAMRLMAREECRATVERTHGLYAMRCPLYRTLHKAIQLTSSFELVTSPSAS